MRRENRVVFVLGKKITNLQVRIFIHAILEQLTKPISGIFPARHSHRYLFFQVPWLR
jgi:hypothetical protein